MLRLVFGDLDLLAYAGLFIACWVGAGGAIVPIPGVRLVSWLMIVQQGAALDPIVTALVAASAMVLGQTSYFLAARAAANRVGQRNVGVEVDATTYSRTRGAARAPRALRRQRGAARKGPDSQAWLRDRVRCLRSAHPGDHHHDDRRGRQWNGLSALCRCRIHRVSGVVAACSFWLARACSAGSARSWADGCPHPTRLARNGPITDG